jgi:hypothetical protein
MESWEIVSIIYIQTWTLTNMGLIKPGKPNELLITRILHKIKHRSCIWNYH